jgi:DNA polymerase III psi subunit
MASMFKEETLLGQTHPVAVHVCEKLVHGADVLRNTASFLLIDVLEALEKRSRVCKMIYDKQARTIHNNPSRSTSWHDIINDF